MARVTVMGSDSLAEKLSELLSDHTVERTAHAPLTLNDLVSAGDVLAIDSTLHAPTEALERWLKLCEPKEHIFFTPDMPLQTLATRILEHCRMYLQRRLHAATPPRPLEKTHEITVASAACYDDIQSMMLRFDASHFPERSAVAFEFSTQLLNADELVPEEALTSMDFLRNRWSADDDDSVSGIVDFTKTPITLDLGTEGAAAIPVAPQHAPPSPELRLEVGQIAAWFWQRSEAQGTYRCEVSNADGAAEFTVRNGHIVAWSGREYRNIWASRHHDEDAIAAHSEQDAQDLLLRRSQSERAWIWRTAAHRSRRILLQRWMVSKSPVRISCHRLKDGMNSNAPPFSAPISLLLRDAFGAIPTRDIHARLPTGVLQITPRFDRIAIALHIPSPWIASIRAGAGTTWWDWAMHFPSNHPVSGWLTLLTELGAVQIDATKRIFTEPDGAHLDMFSALERRCLCGTYFDVFEIDPSSSQITLAENHARMRWIVEQILTSDDASTQRRARRVHSIIEQAVALLADQDHRRAYASALLNH